MRNSWARGRFPAWAPAVAFIFGYSTPGSKGLGSSSHGVAVRGRSSHIPPPPSLLCLALRCRAPWVAAALTRVSPLLTIAP